MGRAGSRLLAGLVTAQFALALVLSIGGGLLVRSFVRIMATNPGFQSEQLLTLDTSLPRATYSTAAQVRDFYKELVNRASHLPGVKVAAGATALPMETTERRMYSLERATEVSNRAATVTALVAIEGDYFRALQVQMKEGRPFTASEMQPGSPLVVVVNETLARQSFGKRSPIGQRIRWGGMNSDTPLMTIVGVVADIKHGRLNEPSFPVVYQPFGQVDDEQVAGFFRFMNFVVRAGGVPPASLAGAIRREVRQLDPSLPVSRLTTMEQRISDTVKPERFYTLLMVAFAGSALLLAAVGLWGVLALSVSQRTPEIGVRIALGAARGSVVRMILVQGMLYAASGLALGLAASLVFARVLRNFLYEMTPTDPLTFVGVSVILALIALAASLLPALRATRVDPMIALRSE